MSKKKIQTGLPKSEKIVAVVEYKNILIVATENNLYELSTVTNELKPIKFMVIDD